MKKAPIILAIIFMAGAILACAAIWLGVFRPADLVIKSEKQKLAIPDDAPFTARESAFPADPPEGILLYTSPVDATALTFFNGRFFIGTGGGLAVFGPDLAPVAFYTTLHGLPGNHVTALAVHDNALFAAFKEAGIARIEDSRVVVYIFRQETDANVTSLVSAGDSLYAGTFGGGVLRFDGVRFSRDQSRLSGADFKDVTSLAVSTGGALAVGTHADGLFVRDALGFRRYGAADGLPSENIFSVTATETGLLVSTAMGAAQIESGAVTPLGGPAVTTAALLRDGLVFTGTATGGVKAAGGRGAVPLDDAIRVNALADHEYIWALTGAGAFYLAGGRWTKLPLPADDTAALPGNYITALETDHLGRLWVGTFENGIAVLNASGEIERVISDNVCREINDLAYDPATGRMLAATNQGLLLFDPHFTSGRLTTGDGLIGDAVTSITIDGARIIATTGSGVTIIEGADLRSLYAFHGLVSNRVYSSELFDDTVYLGTLGGLSVLSGDHITKNLTAADSSLPANWVTAMAAAQSELYAGTYGAGIAVVHPDGTITLLPGLPKDLEVNFNAMLFDPPFMLAGSLRHGLIVYNTRAGAPVQPGDWRPGARNVTALASDARSLYVGTESGLTVIKNKVAFLKP